MYALVNTMFAIENGIIGRVISMHRTSDAAEKANEKLQRLTKKSNGQNSYLPTAIYPLKKTLSKRAWMGSADIATVKE
jgi:hypothetical protein